MSEPLQAALGAYITLVRRSAGRPGWKRQCACARSIAQTPWLTTVHALSPRRQRTRHWLRQGKEARLSLTRNENEFVGQFKFAFSFVKVQFITCAKRLIGLPPLRRLPPLLLT